MGSGNISGGLSHTHKKITEMNIFSKEYAQSKDNKDPLKIYRSRFKLNDPNLIYLDGNSLGALPLETPERINDVLNKEWGDQLIRSWNQGWYTRSQQIAAKIAQLIGARPDEVILTDSTSVNLFKLAYGALQLQNGKTTIISDELNFPSDIYLLQGLIEMFGNNHQLKLAKSSDGISVRMDELKKHLNKNTALLTLSHVVFKSAFMYNMKEVTQLAHDNNAIALWDLSHAAGAVPLKLNEWNVDLAIGCTYKYLNGGPGAIAFLYVRKDLQDKIQQPIWGWFGEKNPFEFGLKYRPADGIRRFLTGTPPMLSLSAIEPAVDMLLDAGMDAIRDKSIEQIDYFIELFEQELEPHGYKLGTPKLSAERGSHFSLKHHEAYRICKSLIDPEIEGKVVIPDFREPDNIRFGITPLYTSYTEIFEAVKQLKNIIVKKHYQKFSAEKDDVT